MCSKSQYFDDDRLYLDHLRIAAGMPPALSEGVLMERCYGRRSYQALSVTQQRPEFDELANNRLIIGGVRYGAIGEPGKKKYDRSASIIRRAEAYSRTGNKEHLVDIRNEAMLEFVEPSHPTPHWAPSDDGEIHTKEIAHGRS